jgi:hypothetical protein
VTEYNATLENIRLSPEQEALLAEAVKHVDEADTAIKRTVRRQFWFRKIWDTAIASAAAARAAEKAKARLEGPRHSPVGRAGLLESKVGTGSFPYDNEKPVSGSFYLSWEGKTTELLPHDASQEMIDAAVAAVGIPRDQVMERLASSRTGYSYSPGLRDVRAARRAAKGPTGLQRVAAQINRLGTGAIRPVYIDHAAAGINKSSVYSYLTIFEKAGYLTRGSAGALLLAYDIPEDCTTKSCALRARALYLAGKADTIEVLPTEAKVIPVEEPRRLAEPEDRFQFAEGVTK